MKNKIKGTTSLYGLLGYPVGHSKSPLIHNTAFESLDFDGVYMAFDIPDGHIEEAVNAFRILNVKGFNVTMPHKEKVLEFLDEITDEARIIGSVNTVKNENGKLVGFNTDGKGFIRALKEAGSDFTNKKVLLIGAGGAAKAIAVQLAFDGAKEVVIVNRTLEKAKRIVDAININISGNRGKAVALTEENLKQELKDSDILVNCTSIGMNKSNENNIINYPQILHKDLFVADIVYDPPITNLIMVAKEIGCNTMNGLGMLLWQGALAFNIWTGKDMPIELIKKEIFNK